MHDERPTPVRAAEAPAGYAYPEQLVRLVSDCWAEASGDISRLPKAAMLHEFFSACYQASMMRDEERPVAFRAILAEPGDFPRDEMPPEGLQRLEFTDARPFDHGELQRLSVVADPQRTLIAVCSDSEGRLRIWGLINSGTRWMRHVHGGRRAGTPLPPVLVVRVDAPGSLAAYRGEELVGTLQGGRLAGSRVDVFASRWLPAQFTPFLAELIEWHETSRRSARERTGETWAALEPDLPRRITERLHKRVISALREERHGGTLLFIPWDDAVDVSDAKAYIDLNYRFAEGRSRSSFPHLIVKLLNRLAQLHGDSDVHPVKPVGWREFEETTDDEITTLDEALFELAHLLGGLAAVDGALVLNKHHDLLGFGGMVAGRLPEVRTVWRALDLEGEELAEEEIGSVGARHRAAYRIAAALPGSIAIVISQDGGVRFVSKKGDRVVYWEQD